MISIRVAGRKGEKRRSSSVAVRAGAEREAFDHRGALLSPERVERHAPERKTRGAAGRRKRGYCVLTCAARQQRLGRCGVCDAERHGER
jgi:hypothetical protein